MNVQRNSSLNLKKYELLPVDGFGKGMRLPQYKKRIIIGRSHTADIVLPYPDISAIHCVVELTSAGFRIYDMNSANGTFVDGKKIVMQDIAFGGEIQIATHLYVLKEYVPSEVLPPVLNVLDQEHLPPSLKSHEAPIAPMPPAPPTSKGSVKIEHAVELPKVIEYPLAKDPKAEFSEYIFEDVETLYPIFNYQPQQHAVEVIILFKDRIYSVDYLPVRNGTFFLSGKGGSRNEIEYAYLSRSEKVPFVEIKDREVVVHPLNGYKFTSLSDTKKVLNSSIVLNPDDILCFVNGDIQIYIRGTEAPPKVKTAPLLSKDKELKKYVGLMLLFMFFFGSAVKLFTVDKELEKELAPKRIATILYKKPIIKKTDIVTPPNKEMVKPKSADKQVVEKVVEEKQPEKKVAEEKPVQKAGEKKAAVGEAKLAPPKKGPTNNKTTVTAAPPAKSPSKSPEAAPKKAAVTAPAKGNVDTYKSVDFSATMSSLMSKGGAVNSVSAAASSSSSTTGFAGVSGSESAQLETAKISHKTGSIAGAASGTLDSSQGTEGLASKRGAFTIGFPDKIDLIGSMDPDIIMAILREHIPQFRSCYQRVLAMSSESFSGVVDLNFLIEASGHVGKVGNSMSEGNVPVDVRKCIVNVLKGIKFPAPMGGAKVEVNVPMNLYPNVKR